MPWREVSTTEERKAEVGKECSVRGVWRLGLGDQSALRGQQLPEALGLGRGLDERAASGQVDGRVGASG